MRKVFSTVLLSILVSSSVFADEAFERLMNAKSLSVNTDLVLTQIGKVLRLKLN